MECPGLCVRMAVHLKIQRKHPQTPVSFLFPSFSDVCRPDVCEITPLYERIRSSSYLETLCIQTLSAVKWIRSAEISTFEFGVKWERLCCVTTGSQWNCGIVQVHVCKITAKHYVKFRRKFNLPKERLSQCQQKHALTYFYPAMSETNTSEMHSCCSPSIVSLHMFSWRNTAID